MTLQFPATHFFNPCDRCLQEGRGIQYPYAIERSGNPSVPVEHSCGDHDVFFVRGSKGKAVYHWNTTYGKQTPQ